LTSSHVYTGVGEHSTYGCIAIVAVHTGGACSYTRENTKRPWHTASTTGSSVGLCPEPHDLSESPVPSNPRMAQHLHTDLPRDATRFHVLTDMPVWTTLRHNAGHCSNLGTMSRAPSGGRSPGARTAAHPIKIDPYVGSMASAIRYRRGGSAMNLFLLLSSNKQTCIFVDQFYGRERLDTTSSGKQQFPWAYFFEDIPRPLRVTLGSPLQHSPAFFLISRLSPAAASLVTLRWSSMPTQKSSETCDGSPSFSRHSQRFFS